MTETCKRWPRCADIPAHAGTRHNDPRDELYDGPGGLLQVLPLAVRASARRLVHDAPELTPELVDLAEHIQFLRRQVAAVSVDKDHAVRDAMARSGSCEHHGEEIQELSRLLTHRDKAEQRAEAGRLALLGFLHAVDELLKGSPSLRNVTVSELVTALKMASKKTHAAHKRAWSR